MSETSSPPKNSLLRVGLYMTFNFFSSILIININKLVFRVYHFEFSVVLTAVHFLLTYLGLEVCRALGMFRAKKVAFRQVWPLVWTFCGFVIFNNLSLQYNSLGFYQLMKVLTTPVIVVLQNRGFGVGLDHRLKLSLLPICVGVALATVSDLEMNFWGTLFAIMGVITTSMYQIYIKAKQQDLMLDSYQLLYLQAPSSAVLVFLVSPLFDSPFGVNGWLQYEFTAAAISNIVLSAVLAFCVNLSIFLVVGKTSPISYNVLGHFKLCVVLLSGWLLYGEEYPPRKLLGTILTLVGVIVYTELNMRLKNPWDQRKPQPQPPSDGANEKV